MSSFSDDGRRPGKAVDKSNFTQTCNLLSQFLKERRISAPLTLPSIEATAITMDSLTNLQNSDDPIQNTLAMDFLPQFLETPCIKQSSLRSASPETPQLTILYDGRVLVFDAFPPEKATEVMELATKLGSESDHFGNQAKHLTNTAQHPPAPSPSGPQALGSASDMRYPRRASLLKFLEKRKERVIAKGPYHMNNPKHEGSSSGGGGGDSQAQHQPSKRFDLNL